MSTTVRRRAFPASECERQRSELLGLLADPLGSGLRPDARSHVDACGSCRAELAATLLMGLRLRRALADAREAGAPADAWPRLRARVTSASRSSGHGPSGAFGVAVAAGLAIAMLVPLGQPLRAPRISNEAGVDPAALRAADQREAADEAHMQWVAAHTREETASTDETDRPRFALVRVDQAPDDAPRPRPINMIMASAN